MNKTILTFGHLPSYIGGKQSSGLSNVIWSLANNINKLSSINFKVIIAATDINKSYTEIDKTIIIGWTKFSLLKYALQKPWLLLFYLIKSVKLFFKYKISFFNIFAKLIFYHKTIYEIKPDLIHLHGCSSVIFFEIYKFQKFKKIITLHGISGQDILISKFHNYKKMEQALCCLPISIVFFISSKLMSDWVKYYGIPSWEMKVITNAYNQDFFYYSQANDNERTNITTIATVASISELKGQKRVMKALAEVANQNIHYICIGTGTKNDINSLNSYSKKNNISFEFTGYLPPSEIRHRLSNVDFMILPSSSEGFGLVFLESLACGVPVILPKSLPIVNENDIINTSNSILLDNENTSSITKVLKDIDKLKFKFNKYEISRSVMNYNWESIAKQYVNNINPILGI